MKRIALLLGLLLALSACQTTPPEPSPNVQTDWSKLEAREPFVPIGSRWYEDHTDRLIPGEDYGMLIPYAGARLSDDWFIQSGCLYGLMTVNGAAVTDPVFSSVQRPGFYSGEPGQTVYHTHPLLVLTRGGEGRVRRYAVAAADGSWCTEFDYCFYRSDKDGLLLFTDDEMVLMAPDGHIVERDTWEALGIDDGQAFLGSLERAEFAGWYGDHIRLGTEDSGNIFVCFRRSARQWEKLSVQEWDQIRLSQRDEGYALYQRTDGTDVIRDGVTYHIPHTSEGLAEVYWDLVVFCGDGAVYNLDGTEVLPGMENGYPDYVSDALLGEDAPGIIRRYDRLTKQRHYYRADGMPLPFFDAYDPYGSRQMGLSGGLIYTLDADTASYYDLNTLECVFRTNLGF